MASASKFKLGEPVAILWRDAGGIAGWASWDDNSLRPVEVLQLGFFHKQDKTAVYLYQGMPQNEDGQALAPSVIPRGCIVSIKRVKL